MAVAISGCAGLSSEAPVVPAETRAPPLSFAPALNQGLSVAVGVYGMGSVVPTAGLPRTASGPVAPPLSRDDREADRVGAGFIISGAEGLIVTASHAVSGSRQIVVKLPDQRVMAAELLAEDEESDIALLRVPVVLPEPPAQGRSTSLRMGDWVLAVGDPYGLNRSVVAGIVGGKDRHFIEDRDLVFIQSDLALNPGNSGGPLLDSTGALVGMNTRTVAGSFGGSGVSLSIPIEVVMQIVGELRAQGQVQRPRLGAEFDDVTPPEAFTARRPYASGAMVISVREDTLATRLGLRPGDIIVGMNGKAIGTSGDLARALLAWRSVSETRLTVYRGGAYQELRMP
jgi:serine protease Do